MIGEGIVRFVWMMVLSGLGCKRGAKRPFPCDCGRKAVPRQSRESSARPGCYRRTRLRTSEKASLKVTFVFEVPRPETCCCVLRTARLGPGGKRSLLGSEMNKKQQNGGN